MSAAERRESTTTADSESVNQAEKGRAYYAEFAPIPEETVVDYDVLQHTDASIVITPEENKRLLRKIDLRVLTVMLGSYFFEALDKSTMSYASIMGIQDDLKLEGNQYSWLTTCVYIAILVFEFPQSRLVQILPINWWLGLCIAAWGATLACTAAVHDFKSAMALRTLLGALECVIQPASVLLSAVWYLKEEQARTIGVWYGMNGANLAVGGLLAFGFYHIQNASLAAWRIMFLVLGCVTVVWGVFIVYWLPSSPMHARGFTEEERIKCVERVRANQTGVQNKKFKWDHVKEAALDPLPWGILLTSILNTIPVGGLGTYTQIIIKENLGFSTFQTDLLNIAQGATVVFCLFLFIWISDKTNQILLTMVATCIPPIVSAICFLTVPNTPAHAAGLVICVYMTMPLHPQFCLNLSLVSRNTAGQTKRSVVTAMSFIGWAAGNAVGPQLFQAKDAPYYRPAFIAQLACYAAQIVLFLCLRVWLMTENRRKRIACNRAAGRPDDADDVIDTSMAFHDLTDRQNINFRYSY